MHGRRAPNYAKTLFPEMITAAEAVKYIFQNNFMQFFFFFADYVCVCFFFRFFFCIIQVLRRFGNIWRKLFVCFFFPLLKFSKI